MNFINQLSLSSWLLLKPLWLSKQPSLFLVTMSSWGGAKTHQCPKGGYFSQHLDASWLEARPSGSSCESLQSNPFQGETEKWVFCLLPLCWAAIASLFAIILWDSGTQTLLAIRAYTSGGSLKTWSTNPSIFREKLRVGGSLPIVWHCAGGGTYRENIS